MIFDGGAIGLLGLVGGQSTLTRPRRMPKRESWMFRTQRLVLAFFRTISK